MLYKFINFFLMKNTDIADVSFYINNYDLIKFIFIFLQNFILISNPFLDYYDFFTYQIIEFDLKEELYKIHSYYLFFFKKILIFFFVRYMFAFMIYTKVILYLNSFKVIPDYFIYLFYKLPNYFKKPSQLSESHNLKYKPITESDFLLPKHLRTDYFLPKPFFENPYWGYRIFSFFIHPCFDPIDKPFVLNWSKYDKLFVNGFLSDSKLNKSEVWEVVIYRNFYKINEYFHVREYHPIHITDEDYNLPINTCFPTDETVTYPTFNSNLVNNLVNNQYNNLEINPIYNSVNTRTTNFVNLHYSSDNSINNSSNSSITEFNDLSSDLYDLDLDQSLNSNSSFDPYSVD